MLSDGIRTSIHTPAPETPNWPRYLAIAVHDPAVCQFCVVYNAVSVLLKLFRPYEHLPAHAPREKFPLRCMARVNYASA